ncbi:hypothetical protein GmHk_10G029296 [Glycine max]|nr:hypothetical protein GmHk_10G029296 [Glycine max]
MVRIRGLGQTLGRVIGRALGREWRRPTTFAHRQRETAPVAEDVHVDHADDKIHQQTEEAVVDDVVNDVEGFPSGPHDTLVLQDYVYHVAAKVWNEEEHLEMKLSSYGRKVEKFGRLAPEIKGLHKETNSFHLSVGEVNITLDDVVSLLHLPITSVFHSFEPFYVDDVVFLLVELLERKELRQYNAMGHMFDYPNCETYIGANWTLAARAYLLHLLGCILFANKNATHVHEVFLDLRMERVAALMHMYENLNDASKSTTRQLTGYITLL